MTAPAISVVLPVRDGAENLAECLDSIRGQTLTEFEIIAINDGSTDASEAILKEYASIDSRIRFISAGRVGLVAALNLGLHEARCEWIARMDADDIMHPERLELQLDFLKSHNGFDLVSCCVELFPEYRIREGYREYVRWQNSCVKAEEISAEIYVESPFAHPSVMFRKSTVCGLGGYRSLPFPEDYDLWLRMHRAGLLMGRVPKVLLRWRDTPGRLSRTDQRYSREAFDRLRAEYLAKDPRVRASERIVFWGAGRNTRKRVQRLIDLGVTCSGWIDIDPRKIGNLVHGTKVHAPQWLNQQPHPLVLVYVTNHGARDQIAEVLAQMGYSKGVDFLNVG